MPSPIICIGATLVDELFFCNERTVAATSNPAVLKRYAGGVVRNIAHHLALLEVPVQLITVLGNDADGEWLKDDCIKNGILMDAVLRVNDNTGKYASILDADGSLFAAACTDPCGKYLVPEFLEQQTELLSTASMIIADTNIDTAAISWLITFSKEKNIPLLLEPVSVLKAKKLSAIDLEGVFMITPNEEELVSLFVTAKKDKEDYLEALLERGVQNTWLRKGDKGSAIFSKDDCLNLPVPSIKIVDSTGAGDAALAGWVAAHYFGMDPLKCLQAGHSLAIEVLQVQGAIVRNFSKQDFINSINKYYPDEA